MAPYIYQYMNVTRTWVDEINIADDELDHREKYYAHPPSINETTSLMVYKYSNSLFFFRAAG